MFSSVWEIDLNKANVERGDLILETTVIHFQSWFGHFRQIAEEIHWWVLHSQWCYISSSQVFNPLWLYILKMRIMYDMDICISCISYTYIYLCWMTRYNASLQLKHNLKPNDFMWIECRLVYSLSMCMCLYASSFCKKVSCV